MFTSAVSPLVSEEQYIFKEVIMKRRRVVVTGIGVTVPGGIGTGQLWNHIHDGVSAAGVVDAFSEEHLPVHIGAEVKNFDPAEFIDRKSISRTERCTQFALASAELAYHDAGCTMDARLPNAPGYLTERRSAA